jgi:thioredoxin 1
MKSLPRLRQFLLTGACLALFAAGLRAADSAPAAEANPSLPLLVDLGADKCVPCKMMTPILAELTKEYAGQLDVRFIDVWKNREEGEPYHIRVIPTQVFFGADRKELFRHEGFFAKKDILAKWKELGVELKQTAAPQGN